MSNRDEIARISSLLLRLFPGATIHHRDSGVLGGVDFTIATPRGQGALLVTHACLATNELGQIEEWVARAQLRFVNDARLQLERDGSLRVLPLRIPPTA